jgi:hypothetical protein
MVTGGLLGRGSADLPGAGTRDAGRGALQPSPERGRGAPDRGGAGRDFGAWTFETTGDDGATRDVGRGPGLSKIVLGELPGAADVPDIDAPCPSLRGHACRPSTAPTN